MERKRHRRGRGGAVWAEKTAGEASALGSWKSLPAGRVGPGASVGERLAQVLLGLVSRPFLSPIFMVFKVRLGVPKSDLYP